MSLREVCQKNVVCINPQASVFDAAKLMKSKHVGDLIVIDPHFIPPRPVGIITDRDIVTLVVAADVAPASIKVEDVMARRLSVASVNDDLSTVAQKMRDARVRRMPVVDDEGHLLGLVSIDDIYQALSADLRNLAAVSVFQVAHERQEGGLASRF